MKLLLDECTPKRLKHDFAEHQTSTVDDVGLKGFKNGDLLSAAAGQFDVLLTVDRNIAFQPNLEAFSLAIIILSARHNSYPQLQSLVPQTIRSIEDHSARRYRNNLERDPVYRAVTCRGCRRELFYLSERDHAQVSKTTMGSDSLSSLRTDRKVVKFIHFISTSRCPSRGNKRCLVRAGD